MELNFTIIGRCCDLALHPVSANTAERIRTVGRDIYKQKYMDWWRGGRTSTCGMKLGEESVVEVTLDGKQIPYDPAPIMEAAVLLRRRMYLDSKAKFLALMGYDDELCTLTWHWKDVSGFDPAKFEFFVHRWDRIMHEEGFYIVDDVRYDGRFANDHTWGERCGHTLVEPTVIDLEEVRREVEGGGIAVA